MNSPLVVKPASCKDCHKCLRECPAAAIGFKDSQAFIIEEKCIYCGNCIKTCPQSAKSIVFEKEKLEAFLDSDSFLIASLAPSFISAFSKRKVGQLVTALKKIGFDYIAETAAAAAEVVEEFKEQKTKRQKPLITSCCPAVVNLIEKHYPELIPHLAEVLSPMNLQAAQLKARFDKARVVFIGPCLAKLAESNSEKRKNYKADIVISFEHLKSYFKEKEVNLDQLEHSKFDLAASELTADYALSGGAVKIANFFEEKADLKSENKTLHLSGLDNIIQFLDDLKKAPAEMPVEIAELLACKGGCINGPAVNNQLSTPLKKFELANYLKTKNKAEIKLSEQKDYKISVKRKYSDQKLKLEKPPEKEIKRILASIGKEKKEDEKNCGGCGYSSCREKAAAVYHGFAERKMCIPYMKSRAESLSQIIVESSHNAIIVVNDQLEIQKFNPVAKKLFAQKDKAMVNQKLDKYLDSSNFKKVWASDENIIHQKYAYKNESIIVDQTIFALPEHRSIVGILTDITAQEKQNKKLKKMKKLAVEKTNSVVNKQMQIVQEIAGLLGETTVETKTALTELADLMQAGDD